MAYKGGRRDRAQLKYDRDLYNYSTLKIAEPLTEKQARAEYSRLRSIARKRLERFEGTEWEDTNTYKYNKGQFKPLPDIKSKDELYRRLSMVATFIASDTGSVKGLKAQRKRSIETLHSHGYNFVNTKNFKEFSKYMEESRISKIANLYDSDRIAELYRITSKKKIPTVELEKDFSFWMDNASKLDNMQTIKNDSPKNADEYRKRLKKKGGWYYDNSDKS